MADISRAEGEITEVGTPINVDALNDLESRIEEALEDLIQSIEDSVQNVYVGSDGKIHVTKGGADTALPFNKSVNYQIAATLSGSVYGSSGLRNVVRHTYYIKIVNGAVSCTQLSVFFTNSVAEPGGKSPLGIVLESLRISKI